MIFVWLNLITGCSRSRSCSKKSISTRFSGELENLRRNFEFRNFEFQNFFRFYLIWLTTTRLFENRMKPEVTGNDSPNRDRHFQLSGFHSMYTRPLMVSKFNLGIQTWSYYVISKRSCCTYCKLHGCIKKNNTYTVARDTEKMTPTIKIAYFGMYACFTPLLHVPRKATFDLPRIRFLNKLL